MKIKIRPLDRYAGHVIDKDSYKPAPIKFQAPVDMRKKRYITGLTEEDIAKLKRMGVDYELDPNIRFGKPHPFWDSSESTVELKFEPFELDIDYPLDYIKYKLIKASPFVANSLEEFQSGLYPFATHYIENDKETIRKKVSSIKIRRELSKKALSLSIEDKKKLLLVVEGVDMTHSDNDLIEVKFDELIFKNPVKLDSYLKKNKDRLEKEYAVNLARLKGLITKKEDGSYAYMDVSLGVTLDDVFSFFETKNGKTLFSKLLSQLEL